MAGTTGDVASAAPLATDAGSDGELCAQAKSPAAPAAPASFDAFPIGDSLRAAIGLLGYTKPTEVQAAVIQAALGGSDIMVQSKTGSGKTSAFGIPLIEKLVAGAGKPGLPQALVLLPTRELAHQVAAELGHLAVKKGTKTLPVYGGVPMGRQITALQAGVDVIVGTPGRLLDHIRRKNLSLEQLRVVVLDEADEMLSMGFWDDVVELLKHTPATRQTMLFSATLPYEVAKSAAQFLRQPTRIDLSGDDLTVAGIQNCIVNVLPSLPKPRQMLYALEYAQATNAIIFCNTRNETEMLSKYLTQSGLVAEPLSGNLKQKERDWVMGRIRSGELRYMVATDIAARGIDINDLTHVFNYSLPEFSEVYLHRVGRTGRAGKVGMALSLVDGRGLGTLSQLEKSFGIKFSEVILPPEEEVVRARSARIMKELAEKAAVAEVSGHLPVAQDILAGDRGAQIVAFLLKSYFNAEAEARRQPSGEASPAAAPGRHAVAEASVEGSGAAGSEGEGSGRRRRRRRGRGRSTEASEARESREPRPARPPRDARPPREPSALPERSGGSRRTREAVPRREIRANNLEVVDASTLLGADFGTSSGSAAAVHAELIAPVALAAAPAPAARPASPPPSAFDEQATDGLTRIRVNIGFDDGFKGRGSVAKKISALAGLNEGIVTEIEARRDFAVLKATPEIADMVLDRVDGAQLGKKVIAVKLSTRAS